MALTHNSIIKDTEPDWEKVDKTQLPLKAFVWDASGTEEENKSTWTFPHHFVTDGVMGDNGVFTGGDMFLHRGGLNAAWAAAQGARSGEKAEAAVLAHLNAHRIDLAKESKKAVPEFFRKAIIQESRIEARAENETDTGTVSGYASVWDVVDQQGDIMRRGAFAKSIKERVAAGKVPLMVKHFALGGDMPEAIGVVTEAREDDYGLWISAMLYKTQLAQETREKLKTSPNLFGMSVGFMRVAAGQKKIDTGHEYKEVKLYEVTVTALPAVEETTAGAKSMAEETEVDVLRKEVKSLREIVGGLQAKAAPSVAEKSAADVNADESRDAEKADAHSNANRIRRMKMVMDTLSA